MFSSLCERESVGGSRTRIKEVLLPWICRADVTAELKGLNLEPI